MSAHRAVAKFVAGLVPSALLLALVVSAPTSPARAQANVAQKIRYGTITDVSKAVVKTQSDGTGAVVGSTTGAVAGYALANGRDRWLGGLLGGVLGGAAGKGIEKAARKKKGWQLIIQVDGGEEIGVEVPGKKLEYEKGNRVRLMTGPGGQTKVTVIQD